MQSNSILLEKIGSLNLFLLRRKAARIEQEGTVWSFVIAAESETAAIEIAVKNDYDSTLWRNSRHASIKLIGVAAKNIKKGVVFTEEIDDSDPID